MIYSWPQKIDFSYICRLSIPMVNLFTKLNWRKPVSLVLCSKLSLIRLQPPQFNSDLSLHMKLEDCQLIPSPSNTRSPHKCGTMQKEESGLQVRVKKLILMQKSWFWCKKKKYFDAVGWFRCKKLTLMQKVDFDAK